MKLRIRRVKNIFKIDSSLTRDLKEYWGVESPGWNDSQHWWWVVFDGNKWVGYGGLRVHDAESVYSGPTYIKQEYRGQGLQFKLLKLRLRFAKKLGFSHILSSTSCDNFHSNNNLIKAGFHLIKGWIEEEGLYWRHSL